ncbi:MAG TPA: alpha/beta hydrolase [Arachidicoccus sp.]|nr:alpha/beta hydrolase [Arachidicoccus sp.]
MNRRICLIVLSAVTIMYSKANAQQVPANLKISALNMENISYPFTPHFIHLKLQRQLFSLEYMDVHPNRPNGKTIMLLHGKNFDGSYWKQTADVLTKKGYRVVIPDQLGFGKSDKPQNFQFSFQNLASNTKAILDKLGVKKVIVLGHSMGGMIATRFSLMYPQIVEKLILEDPIGLENYNLLVPRVSVDTWYKSELAQTYATRKAYQLKFYYGGKWDSAYDETLNNNATWTMNKKDYPKIAWTSALCYDMIMTQPVCTDFDKLNLPTLLIIGQEDRTAVGKSYALKEVGDKMGDYPKLGKLTHNKIKGSELVELPGIGHLPHVQNFKAFIEPLLAFLEK